MDDAHTANENETSSQVLMLISGGIDSTTLLAQLAKKSKVVAVMFDYGQENLKPTVFCAQEQCEKYGAELHVVPLPYQWSKASILTGNYVDEGMTHDNIYKKDVKALSWVPARNATMLLIAGGMASERGIKEVYCSFQFDKGEWEAYRKLRRKYQFAAPDLTPRFLLYLNKLSKFCYKTPVTFIAPFIKQELDCHEIVGIGRRLNVDYNNTYSCRYYVNGGPCGKCEQCVIRENRLAQFLPA